MKILGIDIGGSGIKGAIVEVESGSLVTERVRIPTPPSFTVEKVADTIGQIVAQLEYQGPLGVGFPSVVRPGDGVVMEPPTAHHYPGWQGISAAEAFGQATNCTVTVVNDADAAGIAEMHYGAGKGCQGMVLILTLGTGVGSCLFHDGHYLPNIEFGKLYLQSQKKYAEQYMAGRIKTEKKLSWKAYGQRLNAYLQHVERLVSPSRVIIGGGISKRFDRFAPYLQVHAQVVPAQLRNEAGMVGAAAAAVMLQSVEA